MKWFWQRERKREPSEETLAARAEAEAARQRLEAIKRDGERFDRLTVRTEREAARNNLGANIRKALGGAR